MARWVGAQGHVDLAKKAKTCPHCDVSHREPQIRNEIFFQSLTRRLAESVEGLNSSLDKIGWRVMVLQTLHMSGRPGTEGVNTDVFTLT